MSGGSYDYAYRTVEDFSAQLKAHEAKPLGNDAIRKMFAAHLDRVAEAMKAIEWVDSNDCSFPHDYDAIKKVLGIK